MVASEVDGAVAAGVAAGVAAEPARSNTEAADLTTHLAHCTRSRGRMHAWRTVAEGVHAVLAPRFVSTVIVLLGTLAGLVWLLH